MRRGTLRIYLGAAPGVGKTYAMLNEGWRRKERHTDVVVGYAETHGRASTAAQLRDLEVVPRREVEYRGATFTELDVDAVLARRPDVVLVDELAHTNVPGSRHTKRWQDIDELLAAGIDVISTVNIQHLESLNDVVQEITGVAQRETVPDQVVRAAEQVELVDMTPEALRRRMAHGNIYAPEKVDAALANYFRPGNLGALRELALLWLADTVDEALADYRDRHGIAQPWETRERVVVALTGAPGGEDLIRRAARIARRSRGDLIGVHVRTDDGLAAGPDDLLERHRRLLGELDGEFHPVTGSDIARALTDFAREVNATQIVLGASSRSRWEELIRGSVINRVIRQSGTVDVHVISTGDAGTDGMRALPTVRRRRLAALSVRRQAFGAAVAAVGLALVTVVLTALRGDVALSSVLVIYLIAVLVVAAVGGIFPALAAAVTAFFLANYYFTPPLYRFTIAQGQNLVALVAFLVAAGLVSAFVDLAARRRQQMARAQAEAEAMARLAGSLAAPDALPSLVDQLRVTFAMGSVALLERTADGWRVEAASGDRPPQDPDDADVVHEVGDDLVLVLSGRRLEGADERLLRALVAQSGAALETKRLQAEAARADVLAEANDLRAGLLQAVSHDLRTPLASIKASITSLRQTDVTWTPEQTAEFHATIDTEADRLTLLVAALLDMSRIQAGAIAVSKQPTGFDEVVPLALASLGSRASHVVMDVPDDLPPVAADAGLLVRVVANLVDNAIAWSPPDHPPRVEAGAIAGRVDLRVVDRGPGIPRAKREAVFLPFQRLVDHGTGVGLGLAVARGFTEAMGGELTIEDTPSGGTTMVVSLKEAGE